MYTNKGVNMEKEGVLPDVAVEVTPDDWARGVDGQLLKAVDVVALDVKEWKRTKTGIAGTAPAPAVTPVAPAPMPVAPMPRTPAAPSVPPATRIPMAEE